MDVILMVQEIRIVANPVIGKSALPDFTLATKDFSEGMRIATFDQLNSVLNRYAVCRSE